LDQTAAKKFVRVTSLSAEDSNCILVAPRGEKI